MKIVLREKNPKKKKFPDNKKILKKMSAYVGLASLGSGANPTNIPSMSVPIVMKSFNAGYESLTHFIPNSDNYYSFTNAYLLPEVKTTGYHPMKRKCDGSKLYNLNTNL